MTHNQIDAAMYQQQLDEKVAATQALFAELNFPAPRVFSSPAKNYRMRAEFRIWHDNDDLYYAMFEPGQPRTPVRVDNFDIGSAAICQLMPTLRQGLLGNELLATRLFQVDFLSTLNGDMLVTLIYHRRLDDDWRAAASKLAAELNIQIIGRSKKQKIVLDRDYVEESLNIAKQCFRYRQYEGAFSQPNAEINQHMIAWALQQTRNSHNTDLLELYCGNGNFTIPLAGNFRRVLATEISKNSVKAARENFEQNSVENVTIIRMSSEEFTAAKNGIREFRRLQDVDLASFHTTTVLVDPPRAGLDDTTRDLIADIDTILYISCNPQTLQRDVALLSHSHHVEEFAIFDQFPYTHHIECGVLLQAKPGDK